ncbi:F0F1 ATP synthase subunit epsilon [Corynebacterium sp. 153RC1]|uniref:F0F1 ATP synthase subunit epsilon n=1 Tax=unclassified Corynebacterium TaxID=2624378 RepID=UPI00211B9240|nr:MULTISPECIES: F0F1 ATP synthase subunit epsilon [unclassified Corynebacterium]MCQ9369921.1 F0F1 ATP synthase subunit epsilon [Corynebacterium sp. 35RC1]MCQ9352040.1 F0F1 ATP synthase subunit epsilon [Corynebacterium sp. 209RC1]MCQ9353789.1 F0F1 ATP synthase subunit epsilon [Corynebacterium sp. 1222RC1]MCQ9356227.1 F0F1 ATP synthase subunit epsilon [Corynebacterium sp. 122RC1]MCQ9358329.1 F0F1 ATP synthase subunit epsilon [Corynebacterium sp. 142RC1]
MADITVQLVSVERMLWSGKASIVTAQTTEGEIGVLPGHEPMLGQLVENGVVTIRPADGGEKLVAAVQGGFLSVSKEKVTVLADYAVWASEVNTSAAEAALKEDDDLVKARAEAELKAVRRSSDS